MVFINNQKFACESCIKGHRSSSCSHTDRPLYEIKKKGRPVSQCERCRELRSTKRVHSKCTCSDARASNSHETEKAFGTKQKRYIPIVPALPNGLKDAIGERSSDTPVQLSNPRQQVESLLNPCRCGDVWNCQCRTYSESSATSENMFRPAGNGLATLARAAALCCGETSRSPSAQNTRFSLSPPLPHPMRKHRRSPTPPRISNSSHPKRARSYQSPEVEFALPPLQFTSQENAIVPTPFSMPPLSPPDHLHVPEHPNFPTSMPPFSTLNRLAGTGCTCGLRCACPDCAEHRTDGPGEDDAQSAELDFELGFSEGQSTRCVASSRHAKKDCGEGCTSCVDENLREVDLSGVGGAHSSHSWHGPATGTFGGHSALESFFAHAARIPPPGGPVALPKLCCGGSCGCGKSCGCGGECNGCCKDRSASPGNSGGNVDEVGDNISWFVPSGSAMSVDARAKKSCCS